MPRCQPAPVRGLAAADPQVVLAVALVAAHKALAASAPYLAAAAAGAAAAAPAPAPAAAVGADQTRGHDPAPKDPQPSLQQLLPSRAFTATAAAHYLAPCAGRGRRLALVPCHARQMRITPWALAAR